MNKRNKLTVDQAIQIKKLHASGWTQLAIAHRYGVRFQQVGRIVRGEQWAKEIQRVLDCETHKKMLDMIEKCRNIPSATER